MEIRTVNIIGMGALGLLFGKPIADHVPGQPVYIMDARRKARHEAETYSLNGITIHPRICTPEETAPADLVLVGVKYPDLSAAMETMASSVGPDTVILSLMNGVDSEQLLAQRFGPEKVLYSVSQEMDAERYGSTLRYSKAGRLLIGVPKDTPVPLKGTLEDNLRRVCEFFDQVSFPYAVDEDIITRQWSKLMTNVGCNQICMVYDCGYGTAMRHGSESYAMMTGAMREVCAVAQAMGIPVGEPELKQYLAILRGLDPESLPSMGQDRRQKRHSEVDMFAGAVIRYGQKVGIETPVNEYLLQRVREIEAEY